MFETAFLYRDKETRNWVESSNADFCIERYEQERNVRGEKEQELSTDIPGLQSNKILERCCFLRVEL
jgi:hypothetical protein